MQEGWSTFGVGAEITAGIQERCFDYLDAPVLRLGGAEVPMPYNRELERASIPSAEDITGAALRVVEDVVDHVESVRFIVDWHALATGAP